MPSPPPLDAAQAIDRTIREERGRIISVLARQIGDLQLAEDSLHDAILTAMDHWTKSGRPDAPAAWLLTAARRRAIDHLRRNASFLARTSDIAYLQDLDAKDQSQATDSHIPDERLEMFFTCCHPSLDEKTQVALTLRTLGGLTTEEIAHAFLDKPATMGQRLSRGRAKITKAGIGYKVPDPEDLPERLSAVMRVIYLIFNEGYRASSGPDLTRSDLSREAIRLGRIVSKLMPDTPELRGLLALMLFTDARRLARTNENGEMIPLETQNRARWDRAAMNEGKKLLVTLPLDGPYQLQAAIAAEHTISPTWDKTDWTRIERLYASLNALEPNAVVQINWAVAMSYAGNTETALSLIKNAEQTPGVDRYQPFFAAKGEILRLSGDAKGARNAFKRALDLASNDAERSFLKSKIAAL